MAAHCKLNVDAVIFDKDGTLIDFDAFWVTVSETAITDMLKQLGQDATLAGEMLEAFGIHNGVTDINGVLCKGTYTQMAEIAYGILARHGYPSSVEDIETKMADTYHRNFRSGDVKPACANLREVLVCLKNRGKKLAVVTTDTWEITLFCLERLGITELFDRIYTDDGVLPTKPHPDCAWDFCTSAGLNKERVVMVGDTMTDLVFARNAGIGAVGVAKTAEHKQLLGPEASVIIHDLSELLEILE